MRGKYLTEAIRTAIESAGGNINKHAMELIDLLVDCVINDPLSDDSTL
jgi:hypothetical protein